MPRPRALDVLFEFDAPQTFMDLTAPLAPLPPGTHDPWFDEVHVQHSKPSVELAREVADVVRRLQDKEQQHKHATKSKTPQNENRGRNKENERSRKSENGSGVVHFEQLKQTQDRGFKNRRAKLEPRTVKKDLPTAARAPATLDSRRRQPLGDAGNRLNTENKRREPSERKEMRELQELLKRHNKKFKVTHTYEPPRHSVREVKQWEREMNKSYYALSAEERVQANKEIAVWKQRQEEKRH